MYRKTISTLLVCGIAFAQMSCSDGQNQSQDNSEQKIAPALAGLVVGWQAIAGWVALGGAVSIGGYAFYVFGKQDAATAELDKLVAQDNQLISSQYNQTVSSIGSTPNDYVREMGFGRDTLAKIFDASRLGIARAQGSDYRNGGCVVASVTSLEGGSKGFSWTGKAPFQSKFDVVAAQLTATSKAYGKCFADAYRNSPDFREAIQEVIPFDSLPEPNLETLITYSFLTYRTGPVILGACSQPFYAYTFNKTDCR
ncbi:MAG TPA: hypothetical protein VE954_18960 [Oligoflexus sp.]|uniref:hypothetical protein n=1 Tax=Oligoflexus sp. TaxID=1971216 RepID=UPI002D26330C|nr:hypothetical protein [Oligoflexus sp.]HYX35181.1 hypothetical protein [Oligoflexus sp.]